VDVAFSGTIEAPQYQAQMDLFGTRLKNGIQGDSITVELQGRLKPELDHVVDTFDPWARDRGEYYTLEWEPRKGAEADEAFAK
jgi:hypothetical protein